MRCERAFCEELDYNLQLRWLLGMQLMKSSFDPKVFTKNRQRLLEQQMGQQLFDEVVLAADRRTYEDSGNSSVDFHGERCTNAPHPSATDPEARLFQNRKEKEARLMFMAFLKALPSGRVAMGFVEHRPGDRSGDLAADQPQRCTISNRSQAFVRWAQRSPVIVGLLAPLDGEEDIGAFRAP